MENKIEDIIKDNVAKYAKSIDEADLVLPADIWLDSPEATFIHPRGHERGFEEVKKIFYFGTIGDRFSERRLNVFDLTVQVHGDTTKLNFTGTLLLNLGKMELLKKQREENPKYILKTMFANGN